MSQLTEKLEGLLQAQAMDLARKNLDAGQHAAQRIRNESKARLQSLLDGEEQRFQQEAARQCRQILQSARLRLDSEQDRMRWALAQDALSRVRAQLHAVVEDAPRYRSTLTRYIAEAASAIPDGKLVVEMRPHDIEALGEGWAALAAESAPGRTLALSPLKAHASGGVVVRNEAGTQRVDNTFEGRMARMENQLLDQIMDLLFTEESEPGETKGPQ